MTSKEALDRFMKTLCEYESDTNNKESVYSCWYRIIKQDLERLEKLEKVIEILKRFNFTIYTIKHNNNETEFKIYTDCLLETQELTQEEYDLLKGYFYDK